MQEITFKPKLWKPLVSFILNASFVVLGLYTVLIKENNFGWLTLLFFGLGTIISVLQLLPNSSYLTLNNKGMRIKTIFQTTQVDWEDIAGFYTKKILFNPIVMIRFSNDFHGKYLGREIDSILGNKENAIPSNFGKTAQELCDILNQYKEQPQS